VHGVAAPRRPVAPTPALLGGGGGAPAAAPAAKSAAEERLPGLRSTDDMVGILLLLAVLLRAEWSAVSSLPAATAFPVPPTMQAMMATACGPELVQRSVPTPDAAALRGGQVLVEVEASSVNPVDWKLLQCGWGGHFPSRTGWDLAGVVVAMGPSASSRLKPGDRVWGDICPIFGAWAQFVVVQEAQLGLAPPSLSPRDAATLPLVGMTTLAAYGVTDARGVPQSTWSQKPATLIIGGE
jgi:NADPH:quinone reductase-like Zn-dependent oxidoreductase